MADQQNTDINTADTQQQQQNPATEATATENQSLEDHVNAFITPHPDPVHERAKRFIDDKALLRTILEQAEERVVSGAFRIPPPGAIGVPDDTGIYDEYYQLCGQGRCEPTACIPQNKRYDEKAAMELSRYVAFWEAMDDSERAAFPEVAHKCSHIIQAVEAACPQLPVSAVIYHPGMTYAYCNEKFAAHFGCGKP
ncbi:hypothetical protein BJ508DRAFT_324807 [Ascobolus immersus RN42]|uniref:Uncharacterized protein n=1 Tax=Ascobolus immersus RN42 TaxID=1160509 RepID=A0A3N4IGF5_ASCIM|nr:hypothetical protein BJ508DRAFT_324807 [Ascobolus immersus RN42]